MDFSQDNLTSVLGRIRSRGSAIYPDGSWDQLATFTALRSPDDFDVGAFRLFQERLLELAGVEAVVVGGAFGCIKLIVRLNKADQGPSPSSSVEVSADFPEGRGDDAARILAVLLATHPELRALGVAAGLDRVQTCDSSINMRTGDVTPYGTGREPPPYLDFRTTVVKGSVGQVGDNNSQSDAKVSGGRIKDKTDDKGTQGGGKERPST